jgi:glycosyltransferase involved in cell wall biosynthesis
MGGPNAEKDLEWHGKVRDGCPHGKGPERPPDQREAIQAVASATRRAASVAVARGEAAAILYVEGVGVLSLLQIARGVALPQFAICDAVYVSRTASGSEWMHTRPGLTERLAAREARAYRALTHVFCLSQATAEELVSKYRVQPSAVSVVGTGTGPIRAYSGPKDYANGKILFVAKQRTEEKGIGLLLEAFPLVKRARPDATLTVVGGGLDQRQLTALPDGVTVIANLDLPELEKAFQEAAIFAMPALFEPWGLVYLEAMLCRTPVLGLRRRALPEMTANGRYGFLVDEPKPQLVAEALIRGLADPDLLARMGDEGQQHVQSTYTWMAMADRMYATLSQYLAP